MARRLSRFDLARQLGRIGTMTQMDPPDSDGLKRFDDPDGLTHLDDLTL